MTTKVSSFYKKIYKNLRNTSVAFAFLLIALAATILSYTIVKRVLYNEGAVRFKILVNELQSVVSSRINRTIDLPVVLAQSLSFDALKGDLDARLSQLDLDARYPGIREVGLYVTKGQALKRLYHYSVVDSAQTVSEATLKNVVATYKATGTNAPFILKLQDNNASYIVLVPKLKDEYTFIVFDATTVLGRLYIENGIFNPINFKVYDANDLSYALFETVSDGFSSTNRSYAKTVEIKVGLYPWSITVWSSQEQLILPTALRMPAVILFAGIAIALLMFGILFALSWSRKNALLLAEDITKNLSASEEKYRSIFESLQDVYYQADKNGIITTVSPSIENYIGRTQEQLIGQKVETFYKNPEDRARMLVHLMKTGVVRDYPVTLIAADKSILECSLNARLLKAKDGSFLGVEGLLRDVSERKHAEDILRDRTKELERLNNLMINRELRMVELKQEIAMLKNKPKQYGKK